MKKIIPLLLLSFLLLFTCKNHKNNLFPVKKNSESDKFKSTMVESQLFQINSGEENILDGKKGTVFIIPKGAFVDSEGKVVNDDVQIELAEASAIDEMILSNAIIQDSANVTETQLSFFINATRKGEQLQVNKQNPIYVEVASDKPVNLYKGRRDANGNMHLDSIIHPVKYLLPVPMDLLDFLPKGFAAEVEKGLPYKNHTLLTAELADSLYYSFGEERVRNRVTPAQIPHSDSVQHPIPALPTHLQLKEKSDLEKAAKATSDTSLGPPCGINPSSIKAIRDKKFQNTLIATREFETRLQVIFKTCDKSILELYVNNLNKNLWEIDQMAANKLGQKHRNYTEFMQFASLKQTTVRISDKKAELLAKLYQQKLAKIESDLLKVKETLLAQRKRHEKIVQAKIEEYSNLLTARHDYRMHKFGFELKDLGWYNAANKIKLNEVEKFELNINIDNGDNFDRAYVYVVNPKIKSIFSLMSVDLIHFNRAFAEDADLLLWKNQKFNTIGIGFKNENVGYRIGEYTQQPITTVNLILEDRSLTDLKKDLNEFTKNYNRANKIWADLEYQTFFYQEQKRKLKEYEEFLFIDRLYEIVFPCCNASPKL